MSDATIRRVLDLQGNLPADTLALLESIQEWGRRELEPCIPEHWDSATFPPHIFDSFRKNLPHLLGYTLPRQYGGEGFDLLTACQVSMTFARIDASFATALLVQYDLCAGSIVLCGTEEQRQRLLPPLARLDHLGCFCLTEPQSGSDASDLKTVAVRLPTGGYAISGSKRWIGNAMTAEVFVVWAMNTSLPGNPIMGFILERKDQGKYPGAIRTCKIEGKVSMRILQNADIEFRRAYCPDYNVMGDHVGFGASVGRVLEASRISVGWIPVGICLGAMEKTIQYVEERKAFGATLSSYQLTQEKIVRMVSTVASMYLLIERVTKDFMSRKCDIAAIAMTKAHNTRTGREVVGLCREILGGNGIVLDFGVASKFCDMEACHTYEGTYEVNILVAGRALTGRASIKSPAGMKANKSKDGARSKL